MIFSLFAKSMARSNGILETVSPDSMDMNEDSLPYAFEVHWPNLDDIPNLFTFQNPVPTTSCHLRNIEKLRAVDHVIVLSPRNAYSIDLNLKTECTLVFP